MGSGMKPPSLITVATAGYLVLLVAALAGPQASAALVRDRVQRALGVRAPPKVDGKPNLLESYVPASMQTIAYLTEMMKYDLKPQTGTNTPTTSTTMRPTSTHKPAIFAPQDPLGPETYYAKIPITYEEYLKRLQQQPAASSNYFERYFYLEPPTDQLRLSKSILGPPSAPTASLLGRLNLATPRLAVAPPTTALSQNDLDNYFGKQFSDLLILANRLDGDFDQKDADAQAERFLKEFDDSELSKQFLKEKKVPPTRAYVTLLSLYDLLNKESKRLSLNKYQGYTDSVLKQLAEYSTGTSAFQLESILKKVLERHDVTKPEIVRKIQQLVKDLEDDNSYINMALRYIPPLAFAL